MTGIAAAIALALAPYHVEIWDKAPRVCFVSDKVIGTWVRGGGNLAFSRESGKVLSRNDAMAQFGNSLSQAASAMAPMMSAHFGVSAEVRAFKNDVLVGSIFTKGSEMTAFIRSHGVDYPMIQGPFMGPAAAWIGAERRKVILPPLPAEYARGPNPPTGYLANATDGTHIVGQFTDRELRSHAVHWDINGETIDLIEPQVATRSSAHGVDGNNIVGVIYGAPNITSFFQHRNSSGGIGTKMTGTYTPYAVLWRLGQSITILAENAVASSVKGEMQVGYYRPTWARKDSGSRAVLWRGTAASAYDLHQFLPGGFLNSGAHWFGEGGAIHGIGTRGNDAVALTWKPNPIYRLLMGGQN